jgi:DNA-binding CsgD family transcriptional regulator
VIQVLSEREYRIVRLLKTGKSNKEMADDLYLAYFSLSNLLTKLYRKFGVSNRTELALKELHRCSECGAYYFKDAEMPPEIPAPKKKARATAL